MKKTEDNVGAIDFKLSTESPSVDTMVRISSYQAGEPHFSRTGFNRFDDPTKPPEYGTCYLGESLRVAIAETLIHQVKPINGRFRVPLERFSSLWVHEVSGENLRLVNFLGSTLKRLNVSVSTLCAPKDFAYSQSWSRAIFEHSEEIDGMAYMSRQVNDGRAFVLFQRPPDRNAVSTRVKLLKTERLSRHPGPSSVLDELHIEVVP